MALRHALPTGATRLASNCALRENRGIAPSIDTGSLGLQRRGCALTNDRPTHIVPTYLPNLNCVRRGSRLAFPVIARPFGPPLSDFHEKHISILYPTPDSPSCRINQRYRPLIYQWSLQLISGLMFSINTMSSLASAPRRSAGSPRSSWGSPISDGPFYAGTTIGTGMLP